MAKDVQETWRGRIAGAPGVQADLFDHGRDVGELLLRAQEVQKVGLDGFAIDVFVEIEQPDLQAWRHLAGAHEATVLTVGGLFDFISGRVSRAPAVVRELGGALDIGRLVEAGTAQGLDDEVRASYDAAFPTPESKAGALAFPELVPTDPDHPNTAPMNRVRDALREWQKPTLVVWGAEDAVLPPQHAQRFVELIPGAQGPVLIEGAAHFLQEDRPDEVAEAIRTFSGS